VELGPVAPSDVGWLVDVVDDWDCSARWALRGVGVSPSTVQRLLWTGIVAQRVVRTPGGRPAGLLQLTEVDLRNGVADVATVLDPERQADLVDPMGRFVAEVFRDFPVRKVLVVSPCDAGAVCTCAGSLGQEAARLRDHHRRSPGDFVDVVIYEVRPTDG
jgi:hypothetical protein